MCSLADICILELKCFRLKNPQSLSFLSEMSKNLPNQSVKLSTCLYEISE